MDDKQNEILSLKIIGVIMIIFGVIYALVGTLSLAGTIQDVLPGHEKLEVIIVILSYAVALLTLVCGIACVKGALGIAKILGFIFAVISMVALIYTQCTSAYFDAFDTVALALGSIIYMMASRAE